MGDREVSHGGITCIQSSTENSTTFCYPNFPLPIPISIPPPPPSPPLPPPPSSQSHIAPYLIAAVCILGISFLLLSTCTIILRLRFTRRQRGVSPATSEDSPTSDDGSVMDHPIWHITTVGLQQSVIDSITAFKYKKIDGLLVDGSDLSCSVCLTEFEEGDDLRLLPKCSHAFHVCCIDTWLRSHKNCPLCRAPIVNEIDRSNHNPGVVGLSLSDLGYREEVDGVILDDNNGVLVSGAGVGGGEGSSHQLRERGDVLGELPVLEGIRIADILKKNREFRIFSDLGENHRFRGVEEGFQTVRRSNSLDVVAASALCGAMVGNEGSSSDRSFNFGCSEGGNSGVVLQEKKIELQERGNKSSSIDRSLQKGPVSMKRSLSLGSRFFSFRRSKSQASILPL